MLCLLWRLNMCIVACVVEERPDSVVEVGRAVCSLYPPIVHLGLVAARDDWQLREKGALLKLHEAGAVASRSLCEHD